MIWSCAIIIICAVCSRVFPQATCSIKRGIPRNVQTNLWNDLRTALLRLWTTFRTAREVSIGWMIIGHIANIQHSLYVRLFLKYICNSNYAQYISFLRLLQPFDVIILSWERHCFFMISKDGMMEVLGALSLRLSP